MERPPVLAANDARFASVPLFATRPRLVRRILLMATLVGVTALMFIAPLAVLPGASAPGPSAAAPSPAPISAPAGETAPPSTSSLPGEVPSGDPVDLASLISAQRHSLAAPANLSNLPAVAGLSNGHASVTGQLPISSPTPPAVTAATTSSSRIRPASGPIEYGYVTGEIVSSFRPYSPISGATINADPLTGFCPPAGCISNQSGADGTFKIEATVGENQIIVQNAYYMTNRTWTYVSAGAIVNVGTIQLIPDGYVTGVIRGDDPSHEYVPAINVTATTRDGSFTATPSAHSNSQGQFTVPVPAAPSIIAFSPILPGSPYQSNQTFVNVSAGQTVNIGTVYMDHPTLVSVEIEDSIARVPITGADGVAAALTVCSKVTGYCPEQGAVGGGPILTAFAPVGPDTLTVEATGYVVNDSSLGWVPAKPLGSAPIPMGVVYLVPIGAISLYSNVTGVPQPYGHSQPSATWPVPVVPGVGTIYVTDCSLDAVFAGVLTPSGNMTEDDCSTACVNPGIEGAIAAFPLRNFFELTPSTSTECDPYEIMWPIPPDLPVFPNWGWANVTPDLYTFAGDVGLLPGTYVEGSVFPASEQDWNAEACSTDETNICGPGVYSDQGYYEDYENEVPNGCPQPVDPQAQSDEIPATTFCVPAPPGPVEISITSPNASSNFTWASDPPLKWTAFPLPLSAASTPSVQAINLTSARVSGRVLQARSLTPVEGLPSVSACPAGILPAAVACRSGAVNSTGYFSFWAPVGWDRVTVSATNYVTNETWVDVVQSNSTGTILLTPFGSVVGRVVNSVGTGIYEASVKICPATEPTGCTLLGASGLANTGGFYYGTTPSGPLPLGSYQVVATATGYSTDWTWLNVTTPGQNFTVPTISLAPLSTLPSAGPARFVGSPVSNASSGIGEWITGTVLDADHGVPLLNAAIFASPVNGATPILLSSIRSSGGEFNDSLPVGLYNVSISQVGFYPDSFFLNVTGNVSSVDLGTFSLQPYPTITGRLVIGPESWTKSVTEAMGMGPGEATVEACTNLGSSCQSGTVDSAGDFNISAPVGNYNFLEGNGAGTGTGTATGGFDFNKTFFNVTNGTPTRPLTMAINIFGVITGTVVDAADHSTPVRYDGAVADETYPIDLTEPEELTADGGYAIIIAETEQLNMTFGGVGAWIPINVSIPVNINTTGGHAQLVLDPGGVLDLGDQYSVHHYGWIDAEVRNAVTHLALPYATVTADEPGFLWGAPVIYSAFAVANGAGFANVTAPPSMPAGTLLLVNVSAPDYEYHTQNVTVNSSEVTYLNGSSASHIRPIAIEPWGWISGSVSDAVTGRALSGVAVSATANGGLLTGGLGIATNGLGRFLTDAPVSKTTQLSLSLPGYTSNVTLYNVTSGASITVPPVHLTGDGLVEGRIVALPSGAPVAGATVQVCKTSQISCADTVTTNATGVFVIGAAASIDAIEVTAAGFVNNVPVILPITSDSWTWVGTIPLYQYATVIGTIVGLPDGFLLSDANASLCGLPGNGQESGACFVTVQTGPTGQFSVQAAAGEYVLQANTTFYNDTYLTVSLSPGETLSVGTLFVQEFGTMSGSVESITSDSTVAGATVSACENWGAATCLAPTTTGPDGGYLLAGPSGSYTVEVNAAGYQSAYARVTLGIATDTSVPTFLLTPIGPGNHYTITGTVTSATGAPIPDAIVTGSGGYTSFSNASGGYLLVLPWGSIVLSASSSGYLTETQSRVITAPTSGVDFVLRPMVYTVSGVVTDGLTGHALGGVIVYQNGVPVGNASSATGAFTLDLTNGTHALVAEPPAGTTTWQSEPFSVAIDGAPAVRDLALYPPSVLVTGVVVDNLTGTPVVGASLAVAGTTLENVAWSGTATSGPSGRFTLTAYPGTYVLSARASGFATSTRPLALAVPTNGSAPAAVTVALAPATTTVAGTAGPSNAAWQWTAITLVVAFGAVGATVVLVQRGRSSPPSGGRPPGPG